MEISIGSLLISAVLLAAVLVMFAASTVSNTLVGTAVNDAADLSGQRARTSISIQSASIAGNTTVTVAVKNTGSTEVTDFANVDFIVAYASSTPGLISVRLSYKKSAPGSNEWTVATIAPDTFQPGTVNPGETMSLKGILSPPMLKPATGTVAIATPNGVATSASLANP